MDRAFSRRVLALKVMPRASSIAHHSSGERPASNMAEPVGKSESAYKADSRIVRLRILYSASSNVRFELKHGYRNLPHHSLQYCVGYVCNMEQAVAWNEWR